MTVVRGLYRQFQQLIHEVAKFGVVGAVGVLVTNVGYALLHIRFGLGPVTATTIATIVATAVSYVGNRYWTFRHRERTSVAREGVIFFVLNGIGLLIQDAVVAFNFYILGTGTTRPPSSSRSTSASRSPPCSGSGPTADGCGPRPGTGPRRAPAGASRPASPAAPPMARSARPPAARAGPERGRPRARPPARERATGGSDQSARRNRPSGTAGTARHQPARGQAAARHRR